MGWSVIELKDTNESFDSGLFKVDTREPSGNFKKKQKGIKFWNITLALVVGIFAFMLSSNLKFFRNLNWKANESVHVTKQILNLWAAVNCLMNNVEKWPNMTFFTIIHEKVKK